MFRIRLAIFGGRKEVFGRCYIPQEGALIVVSNHVSDADPWWISDLFPSNRVIHWWAKKELYDVRARMRDYIELKKLPVPIAYVLAVGTKWVVSRSQTIPVDRENLHARLNRQAMQKSKEVFEKGGIIGIFGEGGIGREGEAKAIFVKLSLKYKVPILPIQLTRDSIVIGAPIRLWEKEACIEAPTDLAHYVMDHIKHLREKEAEAVVA